MVPVRPSATEQLFGVSLSTTASRGGGVSRVERVDEIPVDGAGLPREQGDGQGNRESDGMDGDRRGKPRMEKARDADGKQSGEHHRGRTRRDRPNEERPVHYLSINLKNNIPSVRR